MLFGLHKFYVLIYRINEIIIIKKNIYINFKILNNKKN